MATRARLPDLVLFSIQMTNFSAGKSFAIDPLAEGTPLDLETAIEFDKTLPSQKQEFLIPQVKVNGKTQECIYLCGNSLGLQPKGTRELLNQELDVWASKGVDGHFDHPFERPWVTIDDHVTKQSAHIVGAKPDEVCIMNTLTANLHFLMVSFYRPSGNRTKILMEAKAFPSDYFAISSQVKFHGQDPSKSIIQVQPRPGKDTIRTEDILKTIEEEGDNIALVLFSGVQYYTGQFFEMEHITTKAKTKGCMVGWDLAHAVGNVLLRLHDWDVDFAVWCSYKYLNSGPGGIAGAFVHEKHFKDLNMPRFSGWWGSSPEKKFEMDLDFVPITGANSYRVSNPCVLAVVAMKASLDLFERFSMEEYYQRVNHMSSYFYHLVESQISKDEVRIMSPNDPKQRGCQLSLFFKTSGKMEEVFQQFVRKGVVCDRRKPDVIRVAAIPLYNTYTDIWRFCQILKEALQIN